MITGTIVCVCAYEQSDYNYLPTDPPHIVSYLVNPVAEEGSDLTISCTATGYPPPEYHWERQRQTMPSKALGVDSRILTIPNITMEDGGSYTCTVSNPAGIDESKPIFPILISANTSLYGKFILLDS